MIKLLAAVVALQLVAAPALADVYVPAHTDPLGHFVPAHYERSTSSGAPLPADPPYSPQPTTQRHNDGNELSAYAPVSRPRPTTGVEDGTAGDGWLARSRQQSTGGQ